MKKLMGDQDNIRENLFSYIQAFSPAVRDIFECFDFHIQVERLAKANLLYLVTEKFANIDLHPDNVSNDQMGSVFEELIRKFAELSNETAGEHFTPREVIRLMVNLLFKPALGMNPDIMQRYAANRLRVVRQVHYSIHDRALSIDLVLFLNGIPVATAELKTDFTQSIHDAVDQYRFDRIPKPKGQTPEPLLTFPGGALFHFAISSSEVRMVTRLAPTSSS